MPSIRSHQHIVLELTFHGLLMFEWTHSFVVLFLITTKLTINWMIIVWFGLSSLISLVIIKSFNYVMFPWLWNLQLDEPTTCVQWGQQTLQTLLSLLCHKLWHTIRRHIFIREFLKLYFIYVTCCMSRGVLVYHHTTEALSVDPWGKCWAPITMSLLPCCCCHLPSASTCLCLSLCMCQRVSRYCCYLYTNEEELNRTCKLLHWLIQIKMLVI